MAELPTDGMQYDGTGWTGSVGISLQKQDLEKGDFVGGASKLKELKEMARALQGENPTNLLASTNLSNKIKALEIETSIATATMIEQSNLLLAKVITNSNIAQSLVTKEASSNDMLMQGVMLDALLDQTKAIKEQTKAIQEQKLKIDGDSLTMGDVNFDTDAIVEKINDAIEEQRRFNNETISFNQKQKEVNETLLKKLNEETAKDISYNGKNYSKTEIDKLASLENLKGLGDENEFGLNDALELVEDFFTDGFDIETNPIEILINSLKDSLKTEFNDINIKYNLGLENLK